MAPNSFNVIVRVHNITLISPFCPTASKIDLSRANEILVMIQNCFLMAISSANRLWNLLKHFFPIPPL